MSIFNLIIVLICSIFGAYFINKVLEEITAKSNSRRKAIEEEERARAAEIEASSHDIIDSNKNGESKSSEATLDD